MTADTVRAESANTLLTTTKRRSVRGVVNSMTNSELNIAINDI